MELDLGAVRYRATLVDEAFADHHPEPIDRDHDFVRGNANADRRVDLSDSVFTISYLFLGGGEPVCLDAADSNNDSLNNFTDPIYSLNFLFLCGTAIASPYPECGIDAGPADLLGWGRALSERRGALGSSLLKELLDLSLRPRRRLPYSTFEQPEAGSGVGQGFRPRLWR